MTGELDRRSEISAVDSVGLVTEQIVPIAKQYPYGFWAFLFLAALIGTALFADEVPNQRAFLGLCLSHSAGFITVPAAFRICHGVFLRWGASVGDYVLADDNELIVRWFNEEMHFFEGSVSMYIAGLALSLLAVGAFLSGGYFAFASLPATVFALVITFTSAFLAGIGLYAMYMASRAIWRLGKLAQIRLHVDTTVFGVLQTGVTLVKCWFAIGLVWCIYTLSALLGLHDISVAAWLKSFPVWLLAAPTLPLIFGSFIISQVPLHQRMVDHKRGELRRIDRLLEKLKPEQVDHLTPERQISIEFLQRQRAEVAKLPEWPFNGKALFGLGASSTVAAVVPLVVSSIVKSALG